MSFKIRHKGRWNPACPKHARHYTMPCNNAEVDVNPVKLPKLSLLFVENSCIVFSKFLKSDVKIISVEDRGDTDTIQRWYIGEVSSHITCGSLYWSIPETVQVCIHIDKSVILKIKVIYWRKKFSDSRANFAALSVIKKCNIAGIKFHQLPQNSQALKS